jgi:hypothetical protein
VKKQSLKCSAVWFDTCLRTWGYGLVCGNEEDAQETILLSCKKEGASMVLHILCVPLSRLFRKGVVKFSIH